MGKHRTPPSLIWYPNQRVIRTVLSRLVAGIPTGVAIIGIVAAHWPAEWLLAAAAASISLQGLVTKIMAVPAVNAWLTGVGAGSVPRSATDDVDTLDAAPPASAEERP